MPERPPGQLLGGDDHPQVLRSRRPVAKPPYSSGTERPKPPSSREPAMIDSGMSAFVAVHVLGVGADLLGGEAVERVGHHREVLVEVAGTGRLGEGGEEGGVAVGGDERGERARTSRRRRPRAPRGRGPRRRGRARASASEGARRARPRRRRGARSRGRPRRRERAGRVGQVVGEGLVARRHRRARASASAPRRRRSSARRDEFARRGRRRGRSRAPRELTGCGGAGARP